MESSPSILRPAIEFIRQRRAVTFVELEQFAASHGIEPHGDFEISVREFNIVIWTAISEEFMALVEALRPYTDLHSCSFLAYLFDGACLQLPQVKRVPKKGYRKPHWAPVEIALKEAA